jgi:hypothetical protein
MPPPAIDPAPQPQWQPAPPSNEDFQVDRGFDPEWSDFEAAVSTPPVIERAVQAAPRADDLVPIAPFPLPAQEDAAETPEADLTLTDVASNDDLFADPSLEIAQLADGQAREIIVPVLLGEGVSVRRFKLAIRLRLDAVD